MKKITVKTLWEGMAWVADHVLVDIRKEKKGIILKHKDSIMTISPDMVDPKFWKKGQDIYNDKFNRKPYRLWGIKFVSDNQQAELF